MSWTNFDKDVLMDWLRTIKRNTTKLNEILDEQTKIFKKQTILFQKLVRMLEND
jgi:hypothetical protein